MKKMLAKAVALSLVLGALVLLQMMHKLQRSAMALKYSLA